MNDTFWCTIQSRSRINDENYGYYMVPAFPKEGSALCLWLAKGSRFVSFSILVSIKSLITHFLKGS